MVIPHFSLSPTTKTLILAHIPKVGKQGYQDHESIASLLS